MNILLLHPGAMGSSIGAALVGNGHTVRWVNAGRSPETRTRAEQAGLTPVDTLAHGLEKADAVLSICPPDAALDMAASVSATPFEGLYIDGNAVAPMTADKVAANFGARYVDGGIIGPPAWREGATRFYLSGGEANAVAGWFDDSLVDARVVAGDVNAASALKMCYAAYTKGSSALLLAVRALADAYDVAESLTTEWSISQPGLADRAAGAATGTAPKAWRFEGEMLEIAATFANADLPDGFHRGAADIYHRMADLKTVADADLLAVMEALVGTGR